MNPQVIGMQEIGGTYAFDLRVSNKTLKLNRFFWNMITPAWRERFLENEEKLMTEAGLTEKEKEMVRSCDWLGLVQHGANFFVVEKFARVMKLSNMQVYAIMRGESLEDFLKTRRVPELR